MATAVAIFSFLPYCQARHGNIAVDTFTSWLPARGNALHRCVLGSRLRGDDGARRLVPVQRRRSSITAAAQTTMLLQLAVWPAIALCTALAAVLALTSCVTAVRLVRGRRA